jgi:5-methylcytosine-specific restriction endonuclease McrA
MKSPRQKLIKELDIVFKKYIRVRDGACVVNGCGRTEALHASHIIPVSHGMKFRWDERNCYAMCFHHHMNWWHKNPMEAWKWFETYAPEAAYDLDRENDGKHVKFTEEELRSKLDYYKGKS